MHLEVGFGGGGCHIAASPLTAAPTALNYELPVTRCSTSH